MSIGKHIRQVCSYTNEMSVLTHIRRVYPYIE